MNPLLSSIVTTPSGMRIAYFDKSHRYKIGHEDEGVGGSEAEMNFVPSVSTVLDKTVPKSLSGWAERGGVEGALKIMREDGGVSIPIDNPEAWLDDMKRRGLRFWQRRDQAGLRGTSVHTAFELLASGEIPKLSDFPEHERGYIQGIARWWIQTEPDVEHSELMVGSYLHGYCGRLDLIANLGPTGRRGVIDLKTSRAIRETHHFQTAAYRIGVEEAGYGETDFGAILRVSEDGTYEFVETWATAPQFLALLGSYRALREFEQQTPKEYKRKRAAA